MAQPLIWTEPALRDIAEIAAYIRNDAPAYAQRVVDRIFEMGESITDFPAIGRVPPAQPDRNLRERFVYRYRVIYRIEPQRILVLSVFHGSRLLDVSALGPDAE